MDQQPTAIKNEAPGANMDTWDEARIEEAMQRLKMLHIKARKLRDTIPRMIDPLVQKQPSPDAMFAAFMKSINDAQADIKEFTELMRDEASREVFDHVNKSEAEKPYGIKAWRHKDHPDWFRMDKQS